MKMKQKILNNMVYIAVVAVLITTTLIGMFTYYRYMEQIKTGMKDEAAYLAASLNFEDQQNLDKYKNITITRITSCLLYTSPSPRDRTRSRMTSSA